MKNLKDILRRDLAAFRTNPLTTSYDIEVIKLKEQLLNLLEIEVDSKEIEIVQNTFYKKVKVIDNTINQLLYIKK